MCKEHDNDKLSKARQLLPQRFKIFDEQNNEIVYEDEELDVILNTKQQKKRHNFAESIQERNLNLRGKEGVFDIEELVNFLAEENLKDVAVIQVPPELKYCQFMVICTAKSSRQVKVRFLLSTCFGQILNYNFYRQNFIELLNKIYKIKKSKKDPFLNLDDASKDWRLVDMHNIILHVMLEDVRHFYDLESLWTVGWEYDEKAQKREEDNIVKDIITKHIEFLERQEQSN